MAEGVPFSVRRGGSGVTIVTQDIASRASWEQWYLVRSDVHHDNAKSRRDLERRHLEEARARNAGILDIGDLFCAMQGKYDKRSDKGALREEHKQGDYLDALVRTAADFYEPFARHFVMIAPGNHESSVHARHETDLTTRLVERLNDRAGAGIVRGGYSGWVWFQYTQSGKAKASRRLWYIHGYGGGGPVTLDTIQAQRQAVYVENADYIVSGHVHECWAAERPRIRLDMEGNVETRTVWLVKCPTYKDEYGAGEGGWHVETGKAPKPLGCWWLRHWWDGERGLREQWIRAD